MVFCTSFGKNYSKQIVFGREPIIVQVVKNGCEAIYVTPYSKASVNNTWNLGKQDGVDGTELEFWARQKF